MTELSPELQHELDAHRDAPPRVIDPRTKRAYVLLAADEYERLKPLLEAEDDLSQTYAAQIESAMRAGWDAPEMADYDRYDELRP
ncbi:MAG TPA: hypothetical protein VHB99_09245 [Pirellulales bacterium]|nr:hypothetical protein [Pirellulales bacterium]